MLSVSADEPFELDDIVVTAASPDTPVLATPRSVSVITARDLDNATTTDLAELLSREANVNLRSFFGGNKYSNIDIRGMGETSVSNVIFQVDGFRLNAPDLSGADLSSIPLSQIERIEILRGANGVRYGDGAVGGVVNIITGQPQAGVQGHAEYTRGSFDSDATTADISVGGRHARARLSLAHADSDGHRVNSASRERDAALRLNLYPLPALELDLRASYHDDRFGFPGPVSQTAFQTREGREGSNSPNDFSETTDHRYQARLGADLNRYGRLTLHANVRDRDNPYVLGYTPLLSIEDQQGEISERSQHVGLEHTVAVTAAGLPLDIAWGATGFFSDYVRRENGTDVPDQSKRTAGDIEEAAAHIIIDAAPADAWLLSAGYRLDRFRVERLDERLVQLYTGTFPFFIPAGAQWQNTLDETTTWHNNAGEIGLSWLPTDSLAAYLNYARSFRNPNIDELALSAPELAPQSGWQAEAGLRYRRRWLEAAVSVFHIAIDDEIYYGEEPSTGARVNRNYQDTTLRTGAELELKLRTLPDLYLWGNLSYTDARFEDSGNAIPHVPQLQANVGLEWVPVPEVSVVLSSSYTGSRFDGNDLNNDLYAKLDAYQVADLKLSWEHRAVRLFAGANNLFDEVYSTVGYSENYYPMPERNFHAGLAVTLN
ncbi:uncharacterized protein FOKN1_0266 [Thiohalobacter thiocyanaticus]|uniref:TonB-dependent receptor n=1 Tax=Thiohalobacter thiocyanaticus TaxID=585455 RepID=A0A1Z4VM28_9GAMM|nr:TonB-dependent receptor [Thiohalobacter thiocyanaticus]BAZ92670.1 uncharacterized protein FOKN1_0266 [Thiohalobacter thiocyanaticus]